MYRDGSCASLAAPLDTPMLRFVSDRYLETETPQHRSKILCNALHIARIEWQQILVMTFKWSNWPNIKNTGTKYFCVSCEVYANSVADLRGARAPPTSGGPNSFIFMQFSAKKRLAHPLWQLVPPSGKSWIRH